MKNVGMKVGMSKKKLDREQSKCLFCNLDKVEDELHFLFECPLYIKERCLFVNEIQILCSNFPYLNNSDKLYSLTKVKHHLTCFNKIFSNNELISNRFAVFITCTHILTYL